MSYANHSQSLWRLIGHSEGELNSWDDGGAHFSKITIDIETKRKIGCRVSWLCILFYQRGEIIAWHPIFTMGELKIYDNRYILFSTRGSNPSYRAKVCICHPARSIYSKPINVYVKQKKCLKARFLFFTRDISY